MHCLLLFLEFNGISVGAGLPNITGTCYPSVYWENTSSGALKATKVTSVLAYVRGSDGTMRVDFNASWSNSIYGSSSTVTPLSLTTKLILKY